MVKDIVYLKFGKTPYKNTTIYCDNCNHTINAGPNYKPRFCDMCGAPIKENLDKVIWKNEDASWLEYVKYILEENTEYIIVKVKYERTDAGMIGLPKTIDSCPVIVGKNMEEIIEFVNKNSSYNYEEDDFEPATKSELYEYSKICGKYWRG